MSELTFIQKLAKVQSELVAAKDKENKFGGFSYRTAEGILAAVKPHLFPLGLFLSITDEIRVVGDRFYLVATSELTDGVETKKVEGWARETLAKKGMDDAQVTGAASSYARKYALNGMFGIDDSKQDPDTNHGADEMMQRVDAVIDACQTADEAKAKMQAIKTSPKCTPAVLKYAVTKFTEKFGGK